LRSDEGVRLYLLRHGEVSSHKGDVPITPAAVEQATAVGAELAQLIQRPVAVLSGETRRTMETAEHVAQGLRHSSGVAQGPTVAHALRNPDLYLAGRRVDMVSSPESLAAQVPGLNPEDVADLDFFPQFIRESDRIGWWLRHPSPPGEDAVAVAARIRAFARSFVNPYRSDQAVIVAVTHSPILRAVGLEGLGHDVGEPGWLSGLMLEINRSGSIATSLFRGDAA
jgi:broad specificity phosphatase PhoE